jgi:hypothetical protein
MSYKKIMLRKAIALLQAVLVLMTLFLQLPAYAVPQGKGSNKQFPNTAKKASSVQLTASSPGHELVNMPPMSPAAAKKILEGRTVKSIIHRMKSGKTKARLLQANPIAGPASIAELARALKNNPDLIYQYVTNYVDYIPTYGVQRGAFGALVDGVGIDCTSPIKIVTPYP